MLGTSFAGYQKPIAKEPAWTPPVAPLMDFGVAAMSLDLLTQYIDHALTFERMADAELNQGLKADLERQAAAYRRLATNHARKLGLPLPSNPARRQHVA